jgi:hypothetical protein
MTRITQAIDKYPELLDISVHANFKTKSRLIQAICEGLIEADYLSKLYSPEPYQPLLQLELQLDPQNNLTPA